MDCFVVCFEQDAGNSDDGGKSRKAAGALNASVVYEMHKALLHGNLWRIRVTTRMRLLPVLNDVSSRQPIFQC